MTELKLELKQAAPNLFSLDPYCALEGGHNPSTHTFGCGSFHFTPEFLSASSVNSSDQ